MEYFINLGNGWAIENKENINKEVKFIDLDHDVPFGQFECAKDGINWIYDAFAPSDETIKECEKLDIFKQMCEFVVYISDDSDESWIKKESFNGTFIDALNYIKRHFKPDEF